MSKKKHKVIVDVNPHSVCGEKCTNDTMGRECAITPLVMLAATGALFRVELQSPFCWVGRCCPLFFHQKSYGGLLRLRICESRDAQGA